MRDETNSGVNAVVRSFRILETIAQHERIGLSPLAQELGIHRSTVLRFLTTLCTLGYLERLPETDEYRLTLRLFELGAAAFDHLDVVEQSRDAMDWLASETHETVHLATRDEDAAVYLHKIDSPHALRMYSRIGKRAPLHCTGVGKALLAWLPDDTVRRLLGDRKLYAYTGATVATLGGLKRELEEIRRAGYSWDREEHEPGIMCVAAPIYDRGGEVCAALSVSWPSVRNGSETEKQRAPLVLEAARRVTENIGGRAPHPRPVSNREGAASARGRK